MDDYIEEQTQKYLRHIRTMLDWHHAGLLDSHDAVCRMKMLGLVSDALYSTISQTGQLPKGWQAQLYPDQQEVSCD